MQRPALSCQCRHLCFLSLLSNSKRETVLMRQLEAALFVFGISVLAYFYGVASTKKQWFPTTMVEDGWRAAKALKEVWDSEAGGLPPGALEWVELAAYPPAPLRGRADPSFEIRLTTLF